MPLWRTIWTWSKTTPSRLRPCSTTCLPSCQIGKHTSELQSRGQLVCRLLLEKKKTAMENPYVDIIAHPTGRIIGRCEGYAVHMDNILDQAARTNTALELNANAQRFDLTTEGL